MKDYFQLGMNAAEASRDAHGDLVPPEVAYAFIAEVEAVDADREVYPAWPDLEDAARAAFLLGYQGGDQ